ncbi:MAG: hypothetical protein WCY15_16615 [Phenylobacterium sp.]|jgi:hypothetical protein|uniref:hypothetical protein n=1 Tax=Phenylobacterium sp. TaxID=1871053 RepID=UPI002A35C86F|nr:hypothetical protein [Phenylobacterium sp.]MDX9998943.1 hypothetical protein [Phenylobacterium sp.]
MPHQHPNADRWGGPGASHENRKKPRPDPRVKPGPDEPTNTRFSHVSGGGGERDSRHSHDPKMKRDFQQNSEQRRTPNSDGGDAGPMPTPETRGRAER